MMKGWMDHLVIMPILLPLVIAMGMLLIDERHRAIKALIGMVTTGALLVIAILLLRRANAQDAGGDIVAVYQLGNWPAPFGIVLVADRLSTLMLAVTSLLALAALAFSLARWHRVGQRFHVLFLLLLVGLNGAFLTGDLFNLFVFFEVLLAASYGLVLYGAGIVRVKAGLAYIAVNLAASLLFLIGVSLIYGVMGTLNMADLAVRIPALSSDDGMLLEAGAAVLGVAFLVKAGMWPLCFWLPTTYAAAGTPVAAIFAIMTKMGVYVILRMSTLLFGDTAGPYALFGREWLLIGGMATLAFGTIGIMASQSFSRLASYSVLVSSGTLLAAIGTGQNVVIGGALFYLVSSTLTIGAFFLLIELVERLRDPGADVLAVTMEVYGDIDADDLDEEQEVGIAIPATIAVLGGSFVGCALLLSGLPPMPGFVAKFAMLTGMLNGGPSAVAGVAIAPSAWVLAALLLLSGLATLIAMTRTGITTFWARMDSAVPRVGLIEVIPIAVLLLFCLGLTVAGGPTMRYMEATARALQNPGLYARSVLTAPTVAPPRGEGAL